MHVFFNSKSNKLNQLLLIKTTDRNSSAMESFDSGSTAADFNHTNDVETQINSMVINVTNSTEFQGDESETYKVRSNPKGWALLINNEQFECDQRFPRRTGAEVDERNLEKLFIQLGLRVLVRRNLTKTEMRREISA